MYEMENYYRFKIEKLLYQSGYDVDYDGRVNE